MSSKLSILKKWFNSHPGTVTAFSGGVDSSLVLYVSNLVLRENAIGLISNSESLKSKDFEIAPYRPSPVSIFQTVPQPVFPGQDQECGTVHTTPPRNQLR